MHEVNISTHATKFVCKKVIQVEVGILIAANNIYLVTELVLGDRVDCFSLLERQVLASPVVERHFPSVL